MIIARAPLRISLGGGGTDLPSYYRQFGGFCISAAIDKYVFITLHQTFEPGITLKYSAVEEVETADQIKHPIFREALADVGNPHLEIASHADIPAGTGLGSSSSFTVALLKGLATLHFDEFPTPHQLAEQACKIEIDRLGEPIGKQDQFIAAYGGVTCLRFNQDDTVEVTPFRLPQSTLHDLEDNLLLFFTGFTRKAGDILTNQNERTKQGEPTMIQGLHDVARTCVEIRDALASGNLELFGSLMHQHWELKRNRWRGATSQYIDQLYTTARQNGAIGGKLVGAGGGGFLMFYTEEHKRLRATMKTAGLQEVRFRFDWGGAKVIVS